MPILFMNEETSKQDQATSGVLFILLGNERYNASGYT